MGADTERRKYERLKAEGGYSITCTSDAVDGRGAEVNLARKLVDISAKGACIVSAGKLRIGVTVQAQLTLPNVSSKFNCRATVRWCQTLKESGDDSHLAGIEFDRLIEGLGAKGGDPHVLEILHILRVAVAQLRLYPKDSPQVLKVMTESFHSVQGYLDEVGSLNLSRTPRGLLVNGRRLGAAGTVADALEKGILGLLAEVSMKSVTFKKGITLDELITFLHALSRKFWDMKEGKEINERLRSERVFQVSVDEVQYVAVGEGDIVIEDAASKLAGGTSEIAQIMGALDQVIDGAPDDMMQEGRYHILKRLLEKDPGLLHEVRSFVTGDGESGGGDGDGGGAGGGIGPELAALLAAGGGGAGGSGEGGSGEGGLGAGGSGTAVGEAGSGAGPGAGGPGSGPGPGGSGSGAGAGGAGAGAGVPGKGGGLGSEQGGGRGTGYGRRDQGLIAFDKAKSSLAELGRLLPDLPKELRESLERFGRTMAASFSHNPRMQSVLEAVLMEPMNQPAGKRKSKGEEGEGEAVARAEELLKLPEDLRLQALSQEGSALLDELAALERRDLIRLLLTPLIDSVGGKTGRQRLAAARALLAVRRAMEKNAPEDLQDDVERGVRIAIDEERDAHVYGVLADLAAYVVDLRIRRGALDMAGATLEMINRHYHIKDAAFTQRAELAYIALERVAGGVGFASLTEKIRAGDAEATHVLESLDAAATRFLISEIKLSDNNPRRLQFAQFIARAGSGAGTILVDEIEKTTSPSDVLRLIEVIPHAMPVDMAELALGALVRHGAVAVRRRAAVMIAELAFPRSGGILLESLHEEKDVSTQTVCVESLGKLRYKSAVEPLGALLDNRNVPEEVRVAACTALGRIGDARAVPALIKLGPKSGRGLGLTKMLRQVTPTLRAAAVRALAMFPGNPAARNALRDAQKDKDATVRYAASQARFAPIHDAFGDAVQGAQMVSGASDLKGNTGRFAGALGDVPLERLCQSLGKSEATGLLNFNFKGTPARVFFDAGLVVAVDYESRADKEAFIFLAGQRDGYFFFRPGEQAPERRMLSPVDALLEESADVSGSSDSA